MHELLEQWRDSDRVLLFDAGSGAELRHRGIPYAAPLWSAEGVHRAPGVVREIHRSHVEAGARIITALTFRTHRRVLERVGLGGCALRLTHNAVRLAREAISAAEVEGPVLVAGSISPLEDCFRADLVPDLEEALVEQRDRVNELAFAGVDLLALETFNSSAEAQLALRVAVEAELPAVICFTLGRDGNLPSGESLRDCARKILPLEPLGIGVNCCQLSAVGTAISILLEETHGSHVKVGAYPNAGATLGTLGWSFTHDPPVDILASPAQAWVLAGAGFVGGCCGSTATHIKALRQALAPHLL